METFDLTKVFVSKRPIEESTKGLFSGLKKRLRKRSVSITAVDHLNLRISEGEIFGLLGPNGAGKTTTVKMLCTLIEPTVGTAKVNGYDVVREADKVREHIGALLEGERALYWKLTGRENLHFYADLYHVPPRLAKERIKELLSWIGLADRADDTVEKYSKGMKQKLIIAKALIHNPPILFLDEPTLGLDPNAARETREALVGLKEKGQTILLTTHYMEEADRICDRVGIIDQGKIIALGPPSELKRKLRGTDHIEMEVTRFLEGHLDKVKSLDLVGTATFDVADATTATGTLRVSTRDGRSLLPELISRLNELYVAVNFVRFSEPTLEDVFISLTGRRIKEGT